ncbi:phytoene desaturase family protein [Paenibacillus allorhizosphaerae]|uniref:Amine oxidase domain-containing protein n=1 Tax=Paenibacillus allorhizosphaerae TaxID=2849866 RepID=A0ABM8VQP1_9BACL|nr:FAD-dependent oxidoreductase [Paenibacillus allorhizosphaerae]CAG7654458.1 hypothetical protein PAECIP111802_05782 [Paenibacillus allorhizosphaerae]
MNASANWNTEWEQTEWDAVIIGGGLAGLTAAVLLSSQGKRLIVLEKASRLGGRAQTTERDGGMLNLGPHALYQKAEASRIWNALGIEPQGKLLALQNAQLIEHGQLTELPGSPWKLFMTSLLGFKEKTEFAAFITGLSHTYTAQWDWTSFSDFLQAHIGSAKVRDLLTMLARLSTYSADPAKISAGTVLRRMSGGGALYLDGGWQTVVRLLRERVEQLGAVIAAGTPALAVSGAQPQLRVALAGGRALRARSVLAAAGPRETAALIGGRASAPLLAAAAQRPVQAACLDLMLASLPHPSRNFALGLDRPLYFSNHSQAALLTEQPGHAVLHAAKYLSVDDDADADRDLAELEQMLELLQPGWRDRVVTRRFLPHVTVMHALPTADSGGERGRIACDGTGLPGFYAAGDWVGGEAMLVDASCASAKTAAELILAQLREASSAYGEGKGYAG